VPTGGTGGSRRSPSAGPAPGTTTVEFASWDRRTGDLLVKLPEARVDELVDAGHAHAFAPAGRRFRQWAAIAPDHHDAWVALLDEALTFVAGPPPP